MYYCEQCKHISWGDGQRHKSPHHNVTVLGTCPKEKEETIYELMERSNGLTKDVINLSKKTSAELIHIRSTLDQVLVKSNGIT